jgi:hypothetical protein
MRSLLAAPRGCHTPPPRVDRIAPFGDAALSSAPFCKFLSSTGEPFLRPDLLAPVTPRAGDVKVGRRSARAAKPAIDRPYLDGAEHGVILPQQGLEI